MTRVIDLTTEQEEILRRKAERAGMDIDAYLRGLVEAETRTAPDTENQAFISLLEQWRAEDAAMTPEEAEQAEAEWEELKANLNANRAATGERPLLP